MQNRRICQRNSSGGVQKGDHRRDFYNNGLKKATDKMEKTETIRYFLESVVLFNIINWLVVNASAFLKTS